MAITIEDIKKLRAMTGAGLADVKKALTDAGIAANRITTEFYGDTKQVSGIPEQNRVAVCVTK